MVDEEQKAEDMPEEEKAEENHETEKPEETTEEAESKEETPEEKEKDPEIIETAPQGPLKEEERIPLEEEPEEPERETSEEEKEEEKELEGTHIFAVRTTANREDQVMDFVTSNASKKKLQVYSVIRPHGLRGYIFLEAAARADAEQAAFSVPYARGILPNEIQYSEIEHMLETAKAEYNIKKNDIVEIISGAFKRESAKVTRIDKGKEEVVVELLQAAVPIPITLKIDTVKVIRREGEEESEE